MRTKSVVAENIGHKGHETVGYIPDWHQSLAGSGRKAVAGEARRDDGKRVFATAPEALSIRQARNNVHEFEDGSGPAVRQKQGPPRAARSEEQKILGAFAGSISSADQKIVFKKPVSPAGWSTAFGPK